MRDFTTTYDINEDGRALSFTIHALEAEEFDKPVAEHLKNHLANQIAYQTRGSGSFEAAKDKAIEKIERKDNG
jgi:hypothetical protein